MSKIAAYVLRSNHAELTVKHMIKGARVCGDDVTVFSDTDYTPEHINDFSAAIFWGYVETCQAIMRGYRDAGKAAVYLDLAYWERDTHYKVSVNDRHPTAYFQRVIHASDRRERFKVSTKPWQRGARILLAGMGAKAAWAERCEPVESWERNAIREIRAVTDRPILYRPKPSWSGARPIHEPGVQYYSGKEKLRFDDLWAVVTHHSNVSVDGLACGVPAFVWFGVSKPMGLQNLNSIDEPLYPVGREQWLNDIAYCQWSLDEMADGTCWRHLKDEGIVR